MPKPNKDRLYIALYARADASRAKMPHKEDTYHWALVVGPKHATPMSIGTKFHAKERLTPTATWEWIYEEKPISLAAVEMVLVRIAVAKVLDRAQVDAKLQATPLRTRAEGWNCVGWVREGLEGLQGLGQNVAGDWGLIREWAMEFANAKVEGHRFDGRGGFDERDMQRVPTWDLLTGRETVR